MSSTRRFAGNGLACEAGSTENLDPCHVSTPACSPFDRQCRRVADIATRPRKCVKLHSGEGTSTCSNFCGGGSRVQNG